MFLCNQFVVLNFRLQGENEPRLVQLVTPLLICNSKITNENNLQKLNEKYGSSCQKAQIQEE